MRNKINCFIALIFVALKLNTYSNIRLPQLVSYNMVSQSNAKIKLWGWASPEKKVNVKFIGKSYRALANGTGNWLTKAGLFKSGGPYQMLITGENKIDLNLRGDWQYMVGQVYSPISFTGINPFVGQNWPTGPYNTMVAPAINYTVKSMVWYQGKTNSGKPAEYLKFLPSLIADWRAKWQQDNLPFLFVRLPDFIKATYSPVGSYWAETRWRPFKTLAVPNTAMAVAIDPGKWNDIYPLDKKNIGNRLVWVAPHLTCNNLTLVYSGPVYQSCKTEGNKLILSFTETESGLMVKGGGELQYFAKAGANKKYICAKATIDGNKVIVRNDAVPHPVYVRYAWADNPDGDNLHKNV